MTSITRKAPDGHREDCSPDRARGRGGRAPLVRRGRGAHLEGDRRGDGRGVPALRDALDEGKATPLHTHPDSDESMYVLQGELLVHIDGVEHRVGPGGLIVAPRGVPHAFRVASGPATALCLHTPGCCEAFYRDASDPITGDADPARTVDFGRVRESAAKNGGIEILGPPPFAPADAPVSARYPRSDSNRHR